MVIQTRSASPYLHVQCLDLPHETILILHQLFRVASVFISVLLHDNTLICTIADPSEALLLLVEMLDHDITFKVVERMLFW